ncbi:hypothetical protein [Endozoicomonas sp. 8E]|uniref:hypothetical protein n=1 Tax=Endozoicomonas sp. 8E TaxID=3035692 RepID=UPI00293924CF|nr:hypothetical protein [Endozoicomonas sp. 8E]WOG29685.1 hypothetical protein P6910_08525 [Endozoicomonas sp. 8E]
MFPKLSTIYIPVRPLPSVSENSIKKLDVENEKGDPEFSIDLDEMHARASQESYLVWAGIVSDKADQINHFEITVARGESVFLKFQPKSGYDCKFHMTAIRHRDVKIFLVNDYTDKRVIKASRIVGEQGQDKIFVLADEVPDYSARLRSFHLLLRHIQGTDVKELITRLASKGFYLKDGFVRCNGCEYRKTLKQFTDYMDSSGSYLASMKSMLAVVQTILGKSDVEHDDDNCYLAKTDKKTFLRVSYPPDPKVDGGYSEQGHYLVCQAGRKNCIECPSYTERWPYKKLKEIYAEHPQKKYRDRFLNHDNQSFLFTTTVPKSAMLSQDDLIYEASQIKTDLDGLRQKYNDFQRLVDQLSDHNPELVKALNLPAIQSLLSPEIGMLFSRIIFKIGEKSAKNLSCHDKQGLRHLLDQLLTFIEHQGGDVGDKGFKCLGIYADENDAKKAARKEFSALSGQSEISPMQQQWQELKTGFAQAITSTILRPLLKILTTDGMGDHVMSKIFGVSVDPVPPPIMPAPASVMSVRRRKAS